MAGRIQGRVCHLRNTANHNAVQCTLGIKICTATTLNWTAVLGKEHLASVHIAYRTNGVVRAHLFAHATTTTIVNKTCLLGNNRTGNMTMLRIWLAIRRYHDGLGLGLYLNSLEGTGGHAAAAHGTAVSMIFDFPRKVIYRHILCFYCFHLCTSSSLSITITSRSLG